MAEQGIDSLAYGRSHDALPDADGVRRLSLPSLGGPLPDVLASGIRWLGSLRGRKYAIAVVAQPGLGASRARGLLVCLPFVIGIRRVLILDPVAGRPCSPVTRRLAVADGARWVILYAVSEALAVLAATLLERMGSRLRAPKSPAGLGRAVYLRTDLELGDRGLEAGGSWSHTVGVIEALAARGHDVELMTTGEIAAVPQTVRRLSLRTTRRGNVPTEIAELASGLVQALSIRRAAGKGVAFVYQRYSLNNLLGVVMARRWNVPLIIEANASEVKWRTEWSSVRYTRLAAATERLILRRADRICAVSDNAAADLIAAGAPPARVRVVPNGVDVRRFRDAEPAALPFPPGSFVVGFAGLFYPWHGACDLAQAFAMLHRRRPNSRLLLVGDGEDAPRVRAVLDRAGCLDAVHMPGMVPPAAVPGYLAAAEVLASPHIDIRGFIGSPIKLFEYMAAGRAIVASRVAQVAQILRHERTALLVAPGRPNELAEALDRLGEDTALRTRLGKEAAKEAAEQHSWRARVEAVLAAGDR